MLLNLQGIQVPPSLHPSHLSQEPQLVQVACPQMVLLGAQALPGGHEGLQAPDETRQQISVRRKWKIYHMSSFL